MKSFKRRSAYSVNRLRKQIDEAKCQTEFFFLFLQSLASGISKKRKRHKCLCNEALRLVYSDRFSENRSMQKVCKNWSGRNMRFFVDAWRHGPTEENGPWIQYSVVTRMSEIVAIKLGRYRIKILTFSKSISFAACVYAVLHRPNPKWSEIRLTMRRK